TLMEIKSVMMLPREELAESDALAGTDDPADPRYELVQQLLAYKRFKDAATALDRRRADFAARFPRRPAALAADPADAAPPELDLEDVSVWDLLEAFNALMEQVGEGGAMHEVVDDDTPIQLHEADIVDRLQREGPTSLQRMFIGRRSVGEMVGLFLALLELLRQRRVRAVQDRLLGEICLELLADSETADDDAPAATGAADLDPADPDRFDWPDENARQRYARRIDRRRRGQSVREDEEMEADLKALEEQEQASEVPLPIPPPTPPVEPAGNVPPPALESAFDDDLVDDDDDEEDDGLDDETEDEEDDLDEEDDEFDEFDDDDDLDIDDDDDDDDDEPKLDDEEEEDLI
ncbi:MAG: segregation/condensation protein A, partial [Phycisphaerae bacterium]|nr:segregation/condensation protein A [Phycisphaerae bacterium]